MRNTAKWVVVLTQMALFSSYRAGAAALGDIELNSHLNQALHAQISVTSANSGEWDQARIGLAPESDFENAGIQRSTALDQIKFRLVTGSDGQQAIELSTQEPIKEPLLDFILEVASPNGRLIREYSVMLDPPLAAQEAAAPVQTAMDASGDTSMSSRPKLQQTALTTASAPARPTRSIEPKMTDRGYGPTMRPNTLWEVAEAMHPAKSASTQQVMLAIVKENPEAFYDNNVNALKAGYFLRIPGKDLINQISVADADKEVNLQYQRWLQSKP